MSDVHAKTSPSQFHPNTLRSLRYVGCLFVILVATVTQTRADEIQLRNLTTLNGDVEKFDLDGVLFSSQNTSQLIDWGQIKSGTLNTDQSAFDGLLQRVGDDLFRINYRLRIGDERGLLAPAQALQQNYASRNSLAAYQVNLALMRTHLATQQREQAVLPYLRLLDLSQSLPTQTTQPLHPISNNPQTGLLLELLPIWENPQAAQTTLGNLQSFLQNEAKSELARTAARVYGASLALTINDADTLQLLLNQFDDSVLSLKVLKGLIATQAQSQGIQNIDGALSLSVLEDRLDEFDIEIRVLGRYWLGRALLSGKAGKANAENGMLHLLHLPALYADICPTLAAEALYRVSQSLQKANRFAEAQVLTNELSNRFPSSQWINQTPQ